MQLIKKVMIGGGTALLAAGTVIAGVAAAGAASASAVASTAHPYITSVSIGGTPDTPAVTIEGHDFGSKPTDGVAVSSLANCSQFAGASGDDYPSQLWLADPNAGWMAGEYYNSSYGNCVGIIITSWKSTKVVFGFGGAYGLESWMLNSGDGYAVSIKGSGGYGVYEG